jgi:hypothetical protein
MLTMIANPETNTHHVLNREGAAALCRKNITPYSWTTPHAGTQRATYEVHGEALRRSTHAHRVTCLPCQRKLAKLTADAFGPAVAHDAARTAELNNHVDARVFSVADAEAEAHEMSAAPAYDGDAFEGYVDYHNLSWDELSREADRAATPDEGRSTSAPADTVDLTEPMTRFLRTLASDPTPRTPGRNGKVPATSAALVRRGLAVITGEGLIEITDAGRAAVGVPVSPPMGPEAFDHLPADHPAPVASAPARDGDAPEYTSASTLEKMGQRVYLYDGQSDSVVAGNVVAVAGQSLDVLVVEARVWSEGRSRKVTFYPTRVRSGDQLRAAVEAPPASPFPVGSHVAAHLSPERG